MFLLFGVSVYGQNPCPNLVATNLVTNGNFSSGNTGFTSPAQTYSGGSPPTLAPGGYTVWTNPNQTNSYYASMGDHTTGTGNLLIVDVNGTIGSVVYQTTVSITSGVTYFFSAWFANINQTYANSPILKFSITVGGVTTALGNPAYVDSTDNSWKQFFASYTASSTTTATIQIENDRAGSNGNDLGLDDIYFAGGCSNISNLSVFGSNASIPDLYACDYSFPYTVSSGLPNSGSGYTFQWKNSSYAALTAPSTSNSYIFTTAPAAGKYYLCYDTAGCWKADSFMVYNSIGVSLGPNASECAPISYTMNTNLTNPLLSYVWKDGGTTIAGATSSSYTATSAGTYSVTVSEPSNPGCGTATSTLTISQIASSITGSGTYCTTSSPNSATFTISGATKINNAHSLSFYTAATGGSPVGTATNDSTYTMTAPNYVTSVPGCNAGIYVNDNYSFNTSVTPSGGTSCGGSTRGSNSSSPQGNSPLMITVYSSSLTINSIDFYQLNYSAPETPTPSYQVRIWTNNPTGGPYCGSCTPAGNSNAPGTLLTTTTATTYSAVTTATLRTLSVNYTLTGSPTGTNYWIEIYGSELAYYSCGSTFPVNNSGTKVLSISNLISQNNYQTASGSIFNIQATSGLTNSCSRQFICASTLNCVTPVKLLYINAQNQGRENIISWATASELNNKFFTVERSSDAMNFTSIDTVAGAGNSSTIREYSYTDHYTYNGTIYYRIKQVDNNGDYTYSEVVAVNSQNSGTTKVYPVPVEEGGNLNIDFISNYAGPVTINILDISGRLIEQLVKSVEKGSTTISISTDKLSKGVYIMELYTPGGDKTIERIVIN